MLPIATQGKTSQRDGPLTRRHMTSPIRSAHRSTGREADAEGAMSKYSCTIHLLTPITLLLLSYCGAEVVSDETAAKDAPDTPVILVDSPISKNQEGLNKALINAVINNDLDGVRFLITYGANSSTITQTGANVLHLACERGYIRIAKELIKSNPDLIHGTNHELATPLLAAALHGQVTLLQILLDNGADVNVQDIYGSTALHCAAFNDDTLLGRFLSSRGADLQLLDKYNSTALHIAAYAGNKAISTVLVTEGIDVNARDKGYSTALHVASYNGHGLTVRELLMLGGDAEMVDGAGRRAKELWCGCKAKRTLVCADSCFPQEEEKDEGEKA